MQPEALLADVVHPNEAGKALIADFFDQYFDGVVDAWNGERGTSVTSVPEGPEVRFEGTRLEMVSDHPLTAPPTVTVDGKAALEGDGCWIASRATLLDTGRDWPAVRRVDLVHDHTAEEWTATLSHFTADDADFDVAVSGSVSGDQGAGLASRDFVAKSGALKIAAVDWMPARAFGETKVPLRDPFVVKWSVAPVCGVGPEVVGSEYRYVLAAGLPGGVHTAQVSGETSGRFLVYRPLLR
jgi:hypothetical protein